MANRTPVVYTTDSGTLASDTLGRWIGVSGDVTLVEFEMQSRRGRHVRIAGKDTTAAGKKVTVSSYRINILTEAAYDAVPSKGAFPAGFLATILGEPLPVAPPGGYFISGKRQEQIK